MRKKLSDLTKQQMIEKGIDKRTIDRFVEMITDECVMTGKSLRSRV